jgi:hypothetical protein
MSCQRIENEADVTVKPKGTGYTLTWPVGVTGRQSESMWFETMEEMELWTSKVSTAVQVFRADNE